MNLFRHITKCNYPGIYFLVILVLSSCSPARYVPKGDFLLSKNHIETKQNVIAEDQLKSYILQTPNKRMVGTRFHLFLYNLSNINKQHWPHNWLRKIGEAPVVYEPALTKSSAKQLRQFLENKGYYNSEVSDTVKYRRENVIVTYKIIFNDPYRVRQISYIIEDTALVSLIVPDTLNSLLQKGMRFDKDILQQERVRIESLLKEHGYFNFSKEYIFYDAITDPEEKSVKLTLHVKEYSPGIPDPFTKIKYHPKYRIGKVFVYPNLLDVSSAKTAFKLNPVYDTTRYRNLYFLTTGRRNLKPNVVVNNNYILPGEYYKLSDVNLTYRNLSALSLVRFTNIAFREADTVPEYGKDRYLDCRIELTQKKLQSLQAEIAGTNSSGDLGIRGNLLYSNYNLFRGAEVFNTRLTGAIESLVNQTNGKYSSMREIGAETNIVFPKFFSPFRLEGFVKKYAPKTSIQVSYNYQSRPDYTRSIANSSYSYKWTGNKHLTHTLWPLELSFVQIYRDRSDSVFLDSIVKTPLGYSFEDHLVNDVKYSVELNNQVIGKSKDFVFARFNIESAAFLLNFIGSRIQKADTGKLFRVPYFQYLLTDIDFRYYNVIDKQNRLVYRFFAGMGYPYGNSTTLPHEKKYFSGGPNSIRAWKTRDLGPGSYRDTSSTTLFYFPNRNGDIKLEANIEYRFKLVWKMEAALFLDAGNVWNFRKDAGKPNAEFDWARFYKEIAVGAGFGARFDFSFFLMRFDFGLKLRDPALDENHRWIPVFNNFKLRDLHVNIGIGYPF